MTAHLANAPTLETQRFVLRPPKVADFAPLSAFFASERARHVGGPQTGERALWNILGHITGHWVLRGFGSFIITAKGEDQALGMVGPWFPATWPEKEIGWTCWDAAREGTGMMTECAEAALTHAFGPLGWTAAVSYIAPDNDRSIRLAEKLGAYLDPAAASPGDDPTLVYRHDPERWA